MSLNRVKTNLKQKLMFITTKPSQWLGAMPPDPHTWDLLPGIGTPPENFLPTPLSFNSKKICRLHNSIKRPRYSNRAVSNLI